MNLVIKLLITSITAYGLSKFLPSIHFDNIQSALIFAMVFGIINTFIKPIFKFFTFPITLLTFGFFLLVINALMVILTDYFMESFHTAGFSSAFLFSILLSIITWILEKIFVSNDNKD